MAKRISFNKEGIEKAMKGLDIAADAVSGTIGPKGKNVFLDDPMTPKITNDGATIANKVILEDAEENAGAYIIRNVSSQQNDDCGDGTTTVSVLTQAIIHECLKRPENSMQVRQSLKEAGDKILKILSKKSLPLKKEDIEQVALISAEDKQLAKLITEIINKLGEKAVINVEDSKTFETDYEIVDGYEHHAGFMSPSFINDKKSSKAIYENVPVLITEKKISNIQDVSVFQKLLQEHGDNSCVIVCDEIEDSMLGMYVMNKNMGLFNALLIRAQGVVIRDIAGVVGATPVSDGTGVTFKDLAYEHLGFVKKIVADANKTIFLGDGKSAKDWANKLESQANSEPNMYIAKSMKQRVAKLRGGIAVLRIGSPTDQERGYLKDKAEDAVKATIAALEEGIVEGGGMTLWRIAQDIKPKTIGEDILKIAMTAPLRKIIENAGKDYTEVIVNMPKGFGYDAKWDTYGDMIKMGIIDPAKVERCALENAVSAASTFISTFCFITDIKEPIK